MSGTEGVKRPKIQQWLRSFFRWLYEFSRHLKESIQSFNEETCWRCMHFYSQHLRSISTQDVYCAAEDGCECKYHGSKGWETTIE